MPTQHDTQTPILRVDDLRMTYPARPDNPILGGISFDVQDGEFLTIVGPSGAGKTTLLRCICGLQQRTGGDVSLLGETVVSPPRDLALVFQDYSRSLYPWMRVDDNVALPLRSRGHDKAEIGRIVGSALQEVGLEAAARQYPWQLSGGMQQRVAIARALAYRPKVMVLDEPFASVDAQTRADLEDLLLKVRRESATTMVFVTHDVDEAVYLSNRVVVVSRPPSTVREIVDIDLPDDRDQISTKALPEFVELRSTVFSLIREMTTGTPAAADRAGSR